MAILLIDDLFRMLMDHPDYQREWLGPVGADDILDINFGTCTPNERYKSFQAQNGAEIILRLDQQEQISAIEIHSPNALTRLDPNSVPSQIAQDFEARNPGLFAQLRLHGIETRPGGGLHGYM